MVLLLCINFPAYLKLLSFGNLYGGCFDIIGFQLLIILNHIPLLSSHSFIRSASLPSIFQHHIMGHSLEDFRLFAMCRNCRKKQYG